MLDREGVEGPADVAIVGDAAAVRAGIERIMESGATEFVAVPFANHEATIEVLQTLM
jgi:alkanesulfonate monooxygenase SsuD/methylene tetrahydromethanopterin reductase-like flavin-dependent oxidoreductase (luciferase family)